MHCKLQTNLRFAWSLLPENGGARNPTRSASCADADSDQNANGMPRARDAEGFYRQRMAKAHSPGYRRCRSFEVEAVAIATQGSFDAGAKIAGDIVDDVAALGTAGLLEFEGKRAQPRRTEGARQSLDRMRFFADGAKVAVRQQSIQGSRPLLEFTNEGIENDR